MSLIPQQDNMPFQCQRVHENQANQEHIDDVEDVEDEYMPPQNECNLCHLKLPSS